MNRTAALDRDRAAPSSPASTANRMTATESLLPEIINDFFNKICHKQTHAVQQSTLSFDHFIGSQHQASRDFVPNRLRGPEIDD